MRQRLKILLVELTRSAISWCSIENQLGSGNWMTVLVGGERESYSEPMIPVTLVTCSTGKSPLLPVIGARGSKVGLAG